MRDIVESSVGLISPKSPLHDHQKISSTSICIENIYITELC